MAIDAADRETTNFRVALAGTAAIDSSSDEFSVEANARMRALVVTAGAAPAAPAHGYDPAGAAGRPDRFVQTFDVRFVGHPGTGSAPLTPIFAAEGLQGCDPVDLLLWRCEVEHVVTEDDLDAGQVTVELQAELTVGTMVLSTSRTAQVPVPHEDLRVTVTELTSPYGDRYWVGEPIRVLVQVTNTGTMPVTFDGIDITGADATPVGALPRGLGRLVVGGSVLVAPGTTYDLAIDLHVTSDGGDDDVAIAISVGNGVLTRAVSFQLAVTSTQPPPRAVASGPVGLPAVPASPAIGHGDDATGPTGALAFTGSSSGTSLNLAAALVIVGVFLFGLSFAPRLAWRSSKPERVSDAS